MWAGGPTAILAMGEGWRGTGSVALGVALLPPHAASRTIATAQAGSARGRGSRSRRGMRAILAIETELVGLADQVDSEAVVRFLGDQLEAALEVEVPGRGEWMVCPQSHELITGGPRELEAGIDQPAAEVLTARVGVDEQDAQERGVVTVGIGHAEHAPGASSVELGDPCGLAIGGVTGGVVGHDPGDERLEARVPAEFVRVDLAVGHHDPAEVAGFAERSDRY
jgi:hypothetical protein